MRAYVRVCARSTAVGSCSTERIWPPLTELFALHLHSSLHLICSFSVKSWLESHLNAILFPAAVSVRPSSTVLLRREPLFEIPAALQLTPASFRRECSSLSLSLSPATLATVLKVHFYFAFKWLEMQMRAALEVGGETDTGPGAAHSEGKVRCGV